MRKWMMVSAVFLLAGLIAGGICRKSFTNYNRLEFYEVGLLSEGLAEEYIGYAEEMYEEESAYILKVKCVGETEFVYKRTFQNAVVEEVYQGEGIIPGQEISLSNAGSYIFFDTMHINTGFANAMRVGEEYLVFLDDACYSHEYGFAIYPMSGLYASVFSLKESNSVPVESKYTIGLLTDYENVADSEFFATSQEALDMMYELKAKLLEKYIGE